MKYLDDASITKWSYTLEVVLRNPSAHAHIAPLPHCPLGRPSPLHDSVPLTSQQHLLLVTLQDRLHQASSRVPSF